MIERISPSLLRAYRATAYRAGPIAARIGHRCPALDTFLATHQARDAVFITAWNPFSRRMPLGWNHRMQACLRCHLHRRVTYPATGTWRTWSEDQILTALTPAQATVLARRFRQNAIVTLRRGQAARLRLIAPT